MRRYLKQDDLPNADFVLPRIGWEGRRLVGQPDQGKDRPSVEAPSLAQRGVRRLSRTTRRLKNRVTRALIGADGWGALELGRYRRGGEIHRWMYDRVSLAALLERVEFERPTVRSAEESAIDGWADSGLDVENGETFKPDSLFMEACKPR